MNSIIPLILFTAPLLLGAGLSQEQSRSVLHNAQESLLSETYSHQKQSENIFTNLLRRANQKENNQVAVATLNNIVKKACSNNDINTLSLLFDSGLSPAYLDTEVFEKTLHIACQQNLEFGLLLIEECLYKSKKDISLDYLLLHLACEDGNVAFVKGLLHKISPNHADAYGDTPLHHACTHSNKLLIEILFAAGANPNAMNWIGESPLHVACSKNNIAAVDIFIKYKANLDVKDKTGKTPLYIACIHEHKKIIEKLLAAGANPNTPNKDGDTPLHFIISVKKREKDNSKVTLGYQTVTRILKPLYQHGGNMHATNAKGITPHQLLQEYCAQQHLDFATLESLLNRPYLSKTVESMWNTTIN